MQRDPSARVERGGPGHSADFAALIGSRYARADDLHLRIREGRSFSLLLPREAEDEVHLGVFGGLGLEWVSASTRFVISIEATGGGLRRWLGDSGDADWVAALCTVLGLGIRLP